MSRVDVTWEDARQTHALGGLIEDRSDSGIGIRVTKRFPAGTRLTIRYRGALLCGAVKHCAPNHDGDRFVVGVQLEPDDCNTVNEKAREQVRKYPEPPIPQNAMVASDFRTGTAQPSAAQHNTTRTHRRRVGPRL